MTGLSTGAREVAVKSATIAPRVAEHVVRTPLTEFAGVSDLCGATVLVKCEHLQRTGSFKLRGALSKVLSLSAEDRDRGVVTSSTGNHALGVAQALELADVRGIVCVP